MSKQIDKININTSGLLGTLLTVLFVDSNYVMLLHGLGFGS